MLKIAFAAAVIAATSLIVLATVDQRRHGSTTFPAPNVRCDEVWYPDGSMENICLEQYTTRYGIDFRPVIVMEDGIIIREL